MTAPAQPRTAPQAAPGASPLPAQPEDDAAAWAGFLDALAALCGNDAAPPPAGWQNGSNRR